MNIKIGHIIKEVLQNNGQTISWFTEKMNTVRSNVYDIFEREHIDTELLLKISLILKHNFFNYYTLLLQSPDIVQMVNEENAPYYSKQNTTIEKLENDIAALKKRNEELMAQLIEAQQTAIQLMKKKETTNPASAKPKPNV